jgi:hypothetical protein
MKKILRSFSTHINQKVDYVENKKTCANVVLEVLCSQKKISYKAQTQFLIDCGAMPK